MFSHYQRFSYGKFKTISRKRNQTFMASLNYNPALNFFEILIQQQHLAFFGCLRIFKFSVSDIQRITGS